MGLPFPDVYPKDLRSLKSLSPTSLSAKQAGYFPPNVENGVVSMSQFQ
jgi:hypothetical protein